MRYFYVKNKDGEQYLDVPADRTPEDAGVDMANAVEVDRLPLAFERWDKKAKAWVSDDEAKARHLEDARLRLLSPAERQEEHIQAAMARMARGPSPAGPGSV